MPYTQIAIDGPAASGKSTTARIVAEQLNFIYIDSGAMYRAVTLKWLEKSSGNKSNADAEILKTIVAEIKIAFADNGRTVLINGVDESEAIRTTNVSENVSYIASFANVREALVEQQRKLALDSNVVMDGRDIGTVVFPDAPVKIFLIASAQTRAQRRALDLEKLGEKPDIEALKKQIEIRDELDSKREISPLKKADDAIEITTDGKTIDEVVAAIVEANGKCL